LKNSNGNPAIVKQQSKLSNRNAVISIHYSQGSYRNAAFTKHNLNAAIVMLQSQYSNSDIKLQPSNRNAAIAIEL
jgi:hypothetical protein